MSVPLIPVREGPAAVEDRDELFVEHRQRSWVFYFWTRPLADGIQVMTVPHLP